MVDNEITIESGLKGEVVAVVSNLGALRIKTKFGELVSDA